MQAVATRSQAVTACVQPVSARLQVGLELPGALAPLRGAGAPSAFRIAPPKRFGKLMKSERIEASRLAAKADALAARKQAAPAAAPVAPRAAAIDDES